MIFTDGWAKTSKNISIHFIDSGVLAGSQITPFLYAPGTAATAELSKELLRKFPERQSTALSFRGRGQSDTPTVGYDLEGHIEDLHAVVEKLQLKGFCLHGYSLGAAIALGYAIEFPDFVTGLILGDHPATFFKPRPGWCESFKSSTLKGISVLEYMRYDAMQGLERDSKRIDFKEQLQNIKCPTLLLRGKRMSGPLPSFLSEKDVEVYTKFIKQLNVVEFEHSGHMIPYDEPAKYVEVLREFIATLDKT